MSVNYGDDDDGDVPVSHIATDRNPTQTGVSNKEVFWLMTREVQRPSFLPVAIQMMSLFLHLSVLLSSLLLHSWEAVFM